MKYLDKSGLSYFWGKIKAALSGKLDVYPRHSYTIAASAAKNWYRIANANISQIDPDKALHAMFWLRAHSSANGVGRYVAWFVDVECYGQQCGCRIFGGNSSTPLSQVRILYENMAANVNANTRPAIDVYLNEALSGVKTIEITELYNSGWTFVADGALAVSTVPSGYENRAVSYYANGVQNASYADASVYHRINHKSLSANTTLTANTTYGMMVLDCTGTITLTVPACSNNQANFYIKNVGTGVVTLRPASGVTFDGASADITLQPAEYLRLSWIGTNAYAIIVDGRRKSLTDAIAAKADANHTHPYLPISGGTMQGNVRFTRTGELNGEAVTRECALTINPDSLNFGAWDTDNSSWIWRVAPSGNRYFYGNASTATKLETARTITVSGDASGSASFDGSSNVTISLSVADDSHNHVISNVDGLQSALDGKANDSAVVHLAGEETITGTKHCSGNLKLKASYIEKDVADANANNQYKTFHFSDKNNVTLASVQYAYRASGAVDTKLQTYKPGSTSDFCSMQVGYDANLIAYATAPSTSTSRTDGTDIVTRNFIPQDTRIVHTTGNETIAGEKTHTGNFTIAKQYPILHMQATELDTTVTSTSKQIACVLSFCDKNSFALNRRMGVIRGGMTEDDETFMGLGAVDPDVDSEEVSGIVVRYPRGGTPYAVAPQTRATGSDADIVTRGFLNDTVQPLKLSCLVGQSSSTSTNPWYKVASTTFTAANLDKQIVFLVEDTYNVGGWGMLRMQARTNGSKAIIANQVVLSWLAMTGLNPADFVLVYTSDANPVVELWVKIATGFDYRRFTVLSEGLRNETKHVWTLHDASSAGQQASIPTAGTQVASTVATLAS